MRQRMTDVRRTPSISFCRRCRGFGFSGKPTSIGWGPDRIARIWAQLMKRLGYTRYVAQGGDWGSPVSNALARQAPAGLLGIHINLPAIVPPDIAAVLAAGGPAPAGLSEKERATFDALSASARMVQGLDLRRVGDGTRIEPDADFSAPHFRLVGRLPQLMVPVSGW
jgi:pimeloyl-ACP methyl ester carboxylesterase